MDTNSLEKTDSVTYTNKSNIYQINNWILGDKKIGIKDNIYVIKTNVSTDTVNQIKYEKYSETIKCNSCFPFGDGSATVINYKGFSFQHEQMKYYDKDTLMIQKYRVPTM